MLAFIAVILLFAEKYDALIFLIKATDFHNIIFRMATASNIDIQQLVMF